MKILRVLSPARSAALAALVLVPLGCTVTTRPQPVTVTSGEVVPADIYSYPTTSYDGRPVYLYNDRWYYQDRGRWTYYRQPPPALVRQRPYVQQAPPARQQQYGTPYGPPQSGGPVYDSRPGQTAPPPASAPPATRVQ